MNRPTFSILHTTARTPDGWIKSYRHWKSTANDPASFEYILCVDAGEEEKVRWAMFQNGIHDQSVNVVVNHGNRSPVAGWNRAAEVSRGQILVCNSDDMFAPDHWTVELLGAIQNARKSVDEEFVIHVSTGSKRDNSLMTLPILSATRYQKLGYALWPEYLSAYCDDEFTEHAVRDNIVVNARRLTFLHKNPYLGIGEMDAVYQRENRDEAYVLGRKILERRRVAGFPPLPWRGGEPLGNIARAASSAPRKRIAVCAPGSVFSARWVVNSWGFFGDLERLGYEVIPPFNCYSSDPGVTRETLLTELLKSDHKPDFVLWMDDDNILTSSDFAKLMLDLETFPELAAVFAWCWIQTDGYLLPPLVSCGRVPQDIGAAFTAQEMYDQATAGNLMMIGYSGFPAVLMKFELLEQIGPFPFAPILGEQHRNGRTGEDFAFCRRAIAANFKLAVDPQVKIPHLKLGAYEPDLSKFVVMKKPPEQTEEPRANAAD